MTEILYVIQTFNEAHRILKLIDYYSQYGQIVVIDNYSSDNTVELVNSRDIAVYMKKNEGTTQTPEWRKWFVAEFGEVKVINCSCSELIPHETLLKIKESLLLGNAIVETKLIPITDGLELNLWNSPDR